MIIKITLKVYNLGGISEFDYFVVDEDEILKSNSRDDDKWEGV